MGGFESSAVQSLDEFELQACHYNMACAFAQLNLLQESINSLEMAFQAGFDNYATVRGDPDLDPIKKEKDFEKLMEKYGIPGRARMAFKGPIRENSFSVLSTP